MCTLQASSVQSGVIISLPTWHAPGALSSGHHALSAVVTPQPRVPHASGNRQAELLSTQTGNPKFNKITPLAFLTSVVETGL